MNARSRVGAPASTREWLRAAVVTSYAGFWAAGGATPVIALAARREFASAFRSSVVA